VAGRVGCDADAAPRHFCLCCPVRRCKQTRWPGGALRGEPADAGRLLGVAEVGFAAEAGKIGA
jgi:hypothetical protein